MTKLSTAREILAPIDNVFVAFSDFETFPKIFHEAIAIDFISETRTGLGTEWEQAVEENGKQFLDEVKVIEFEASNRIVLEIKDYHSTETLEFRFTKTDETTLVGADLSVKPKRLYGKIFAWILKSQILRYLNDDMNRIKAHIESNQ